MNNFKLKYFVEILKSSTRPLNIIYPIPILQLLVFSQSKHYLQSFLLTLLFSFTFYPAVNIWNHVNDIKEDILSGKYNVFAENEVVKTFGIIFAVILYLLALLILLTNLNSSLSLILYAICLLITWLYSDRIFFGRIIRRFKDHYISELLSFMVVYPSFTILLWTFFDDPSIKSIAVALTVLLFVLFGIFIKDMRDISGDEMAGLKTLGVIFTPEKLLKFAITSIVLYYISIAVFTLLGIYSFYTTVALIPLIPTVYSILNLSRECWTISIDTITHLKRIMLSNMISLGLLILTGFLSQP